MKKRKNIFLGVILGLGLGGIILFGSLVMVNKKPSQNTTIKVLNESTNTLPSDALVKKSVASLAELVEIPNEKDAIIMEVKDQKKIQEFDPLFGRSYKGDLIVFLPDQTIVFDPTTKTVRDIISTSFYEEVKGGQK